MSSETQNDLARDSLSKSLNTRVRAVHGLASVRKPAEERRLLPVAAKDEPSQ